ncbi:MAG: hypothetical protein JXQ80_06790, partial [Bacteroidales bacterium]|nr:hypothetical protein [Bacteroidales bacterium]
MHSQATKVLIVTSSSGVFEIIRRVFISQDADLIITQAKSLASAREVISNSPVNAVIGDYYLCDGICVDLIPALNQVPLIVLFDEGNEDKFLPALHSGAFSIMVK